MKSDTKTQQLLAQKLKDRLLTELSYQAYLRSIGESSTLGQVAAQARNNGYTQTDCMEAIDFGHKAAQSRPKVYTVGNNSMSRV